MDLWGCIDELGASEGPVLSAAVAAAMHSVVVGDVDRSVEGTRSGRVDLVVGTDLLGVAAIRLGEGLAGRWDFEVRRKDAGFVLDVTLLAPRFALPDAIRPAAMDEGSPVPAGAGPVHLVLSDAKLRIDASRADLPERLGFVVGSGDGLVTARLEPEVVLLGDSGFALEVSAVVLDTAAEKSPPLPPPADGSPPIVLGPGWTGLAVPEAKLYFPAGAQVLPGPVELQLAVGDDGSVRAYGHHHWVPEERRPDIAVSVVVVDDPFARSLLGLVPTWARATITLSDTTVVADLAPLATAGVVVSATWTRLATPPGGAPPTVTLDVVAAGSGPDGLVRLRHGSPAADVAITAATLADVVMNDLFADDGYVGLAALVGAGALLSQTQVDDGSFVLTRAEARAGVGPGAPDPVLLVDYDAAIHLRCVDVGAFALEMDEAPIALSYRGVAVRHTHGHPVELDYSGAKVDVRSTGGWHVRPDGFPLQIPAVRFGQGSLWADFDLDVSLQLGPIHVDRATLRLALDPQRGFVDPELRGLGIHLDVPGALRVAGQAQLQDGGLAATLSGFAGPGGSGFSVTARFRIGEAVTGLAVGVTFPGPIPLASSGFGLFGAEGGFAVGASPKLADGDPVRAALAWKADLDEDGWWRDDAGSFTFWLGLVLGTLPDAGFSLNAHARLAVAVPDLLFRLSLDGALVAPPPTLAEAEAAPVGGAGPGPSFLGVLQAGPGGIDLGLEGRIDLLPLFVAQVPVGAHFPPQGDRWFIRLGTDGAAGRPPGPILVSLLPDLLGINAWAFLMFEGAGITNVGRELLGVTLPPTSSFTVAFGAGFDLKYGSPPFWLEVSGALVAEVGSDPFLLAAAAHIAGSLHLGPFSVGADARIDLLVGKVDGQNVLWAQARVCGSIDLWLTEIEGCVTIDIGSRPMPVVTPPNPLVALSLMRPDGQVTPIGPDGGAAVVRTPADPVPTVWPDTIPTLAFSTMPATGGAAGGVDIGPDAATGRAGTDQLLFAHGLARLDLLDGAGHPFRPVGHDGLPTALLATVQLGKGRQGGRELALNTWSSSVWARALEDGGVTSGDPAAVEVGACNPYVRGQPGWLLGADAVGSSGRWHLPTERLELDPIYSMPAGDLEVRSQGSTVLEPPLGWQLETDGQARFSPPHVRRYVDGERVEVPDAERTFPGCLWLGWTERPGVSPGGGSTHEGLNATVRLKDPLNSSGVSRPILCLLVDERLGGYERIEVATGGGQWTLVDPAQGVPAEGCVAMTWSWDHRSPVDEVTVYWGSGQVGLLGLGGVTEAAVRAATKRQDAIIRRHRAVEELARAAAAGPATGAGVSPGSLLEPGQEYGVVAQLQAVQVQPPDPRGTLDLDGPGGTVRRFRVAREEPLPAAVDEWHLHNDESRFCPEYLRRYLHPTAPTTPPDVARFVFPADAVAVRFWVGHTEQLAARYGYGIHVRIRQVDAHPLGPAPDPTVVDLAAVGPSPWGAPAFPVDQRIAHLLLDHNAAPENAGLGQCHLPTAGTTKVIPAVLGCGGHYEMRIVAVRDGMERPLRTTTFATSAYRDPADLLWELGFVDTALGAADATRTTRRGYRDVVRTPTAPGDLAVAPTAPAPGVVHGDHELDEALAALGVAPWPICTGPRRWALWVPGTADPRAWELHGILLEADEPVWRTPRTTFDLATVGGVPLASVITDAGGCRVLFRGMPTVPAGPFSVAVVESVGGEAGAPAGRRRWNATTAIPTAPAFAGEVAVR